MRRRQVVVASLVTAIAVGCAVFTVLDLRSGTPSPIIAVLLVIAVAWAIDLWSGREVGAPPTVRYYVVLGIGAVLLGGVYVVVGAVAGLALVLVGLVSLGIAAWRRRRLARS